MNPPYFLLLNLLVTCFSSFAVAKNQTVSCDGQSIQVKDEKEKTILELVCHEKEKYGLKSVLFSVWQNNQQISSAALGNSMTHIPATEDMHFRVGGVMETFLTTLLLQLVDEGKVKLDDTLSTWFPDLPEAHLVTLEMLANSTSGYPDYVHSEDFIRAFYKDVFKEWTSEELLDFAFAQPMHYKPGTSWNYSHTNYVILGEVLQKITQQSIESLMEDRISEKLQLKNTKFSTTSDIPSPTLHAYTMERGIYEDSTYWNPSWTSFSGRLSSNLADLEKWANAFGSGTLLSKQAHSSLSAPTTVGKGPFQNTQKFFGLGFMVENKWLLQSPRFGGYSGIFAYHPSKKMGIVIFNTLNPNNKTDMNYSKVIFKKLTETLAPDN